MQNIWAHAEVTVRYFIHRPQHWKLSSIIHCKKKLQYALFSLLFFHIRRKTTTTVVTSILMVFSFQHMYNNVNVMNHNINDKWGKKPMYYYYYYTTSINQIKMIMKIKVCLLLKTAIGVHAYKIRSIAIYFWKLF